MARWRGLAGLLGTLGLAAACLGATGAGAEGGEDRFWWRPSLRSAVVVDDNAYFSSGNEKGAVGVHAEPRLEIGYQSPAFDLGADLAVDVRQVPGRRSLSDELYRLLGWGELAIAPGLRLRLSDAYAPQPIRAGLPEDEVANLVQANRAEAALAWTTRAFGSGELELGTAGTHVFTDRYAEFVPLAGGGFAVDTRFRGDHLQGMAFAELRLPLGEHGDAWLRGQAGYRAYEEAAAADHSDLSLMAGWRVGDGDGLAFELAGGAGALGFDGVGDELRALGRAALRYRLPAGLTLRLAARHLTTPNLAGRAVEDSTGELGLEQRFGQATAADLRVFLSHLEGDLRGGSNLYGGAEIRVRRQLTRQLQMGVAYRHYRNDGSLAGDDFSANRVQVEFQLRR